MTYIKNVQLFLLIKSFFALLMLVSFVHQHFTEASLTQRPLSNVKASGPICAEDWLLIFALSLEKFLEKSGIKTNLTFCVSIQKINEIQTLWF